MSNCKSLKDIVNELNNGKDADYVIPYDLSNFDIDCVKEIYALYIKYGKNEERKEVCKKGYDALC